MTARALRPTAAYDAFIAYEDPGAADAVAAVRCPRSPLAVALLVTGAAVATPGYADESGAWSVAPSAGGGTRPAKDGRPYFYVEGTPGSVLEDTVTVTNPGSEPRTIELSGADADNTRGGAFSLDRGSPPTPAPGSPSPGAR